MKKLTLLLVQWFLMSLSFFWMTNAAAQSYNMGTSGSQTVSGCNIWIYDNGGPSGQYSNSCSSTMTITPDEPGAIFFIDQGTYNTESSYDWLKIYDGTSTSGTLLANLQGQGSISSPLTSSSGAFTFEFHSDGSVQRDGFEIHIACITSDAETYDMPVTGEQDIATCDAWIYDCGGSQNNYSDYSDGIMVIYPTDPDHYVTIDMGVYNMENGSDWLRIYDGEGTGGTLLATWQGSGSAANAIYSSSGPLTLEFHSDGSINYTGFQMHVTCVDEPVHNYNMPASGTQTITACNTWIYDSGGENGNYAASSNSTLILNPTVAGQILTIDQGNYNTETSFDQLKIYDGVGTSGTLLATWQGTGTLTTPITSQSGSLTLQFHSDGSVQYAGFALHVSCSDADFEVYDMPVSGEQDIATCDAWIYDCGGAQDNYSNYSDGTMVVYPTEPGNFIVIDMGSYTLENNSDWLKIYDGEGTGGTLLANWTGTGTLGGEITSYSGPITLVFHSDGSVVNSGFQLHVTCTDEPDYSIVMPSSGTQTVSACDTWIYDDGGDDGNYSASASGVLVVNALNPTDIITIDQGTYYTESCCDGLRIYDGVGTSGTLLATWQGSGTLTNPITSMSGSITLQFFADGSVQYTGFALHVSCSEATFDVYDMPVNGEQSISSCDAWIYDCGGAQDSYANNSDGIMVIESTDPTSVVMIDMGEYNIENTNDWLRIYDGIGTGGAILATLQGSGTIGNPIYSHSGAVTFEFHSNGSVVNTGFRLHVACTDEPDYSINMPRTGTQTVSACDTWIYDDGGQSGNYSTSCSGILVVNPLNATDILTIDQGNYYTESCCDWLKIYDGVGTSGTLLATWQGTGTLNAPITSMSGSFTLQFYSDGSVQYTGFALHISCSEATFDVYELPVTGDETVTTCDAWIYDSGGNQGNYENNSDATFVINPINAADFVVIDMGSYNIESPNDWLKIYDGVGTGGTLLATWQGNGTLPGSITSYAGPITLQFHSNSSVVNSGFRLHVSCTDDPDYSIVMPATGTSTVTACDVWIYDNGDENGDYSANCNSTLIVYPTSNTDMIIIDEGSYRTESIDWLKIYDGVGTGGTLLAQWSGTGTLTVPISSISGPITLQFYSDGSVQYFGFALHITCVPLPEVEAMSNDPITTCNMRWADPGGNDVYDDNLTITQTICSDNGDHVSVMFYSFALAAGDNLYVYDGNSTVAPLLGTYTGNTLPPTLYSSGSCLTFRFVSNAAGSDAGWLAQISCASCASSPVSVEYGSPCAPDGANPFCTDENPYGITYPSGTTGDGSVFFGGSDDIGCLYSMPCPAWYFMRINEPGSLLIYIEQHSTSGSGLDVDFICWGPFTATDQNAFMDNLCCGLYEFTTESTASSHRPTNGDHSGDMGGYPEGNIVDCSYYADYTEWCYIPNAQPGEFYLLLITNYSQQVGTISFNAVSAGGTSSTASTDCSLLAQVANDGPYCEGDTIHLICLDPEPGATYSWTGPNGFTSSLSDPVIPNATPAMAGDYTLVKQMSGNTSTPAVTTVVINPPPVTSVTSDHDMVCGNEPTTLTASGGVEYVWDNGTEGASNTVTLPSPQTFYVTVTDAGGCTAVDSITIQSAPMLTTDLNDTICVGAGYDNHGFTLPPDSTLDGVHRELTAMYASLMGCDSLVTLHLDYYPLPVVEFSEESCDSFVWDDSTYTESGDYTNHYLSAQGCDSTAILHLTIHRSVETEWEHTDCDSYTWNDQTYTESGDYVQQFHTIHGCDSVVTLHLTLFYSQTSEFSILVCDEFVWNEHTYNETGDFVQHFQTIHGCDSAVTLHLSVDKLHISTLEILPEHCEHEDGSVTIEVSQNVGPVTFDWGEIENGNGTTATGLSAGSYMVRVSDTVCTRNHFFQVFVAPAPHACFSVQPINNRVILGSNVVLLDCSQNATNWFWDMDNGVTFNSKMVTYAYPEVGLYNVLLTVTDDFGCEDTISHQIEVREQMRMYVPNSFSPNGDGLNDVFKPVGIEISEEGYTFSVYDRWGGLIFMTHDLNKGWDGTVNGRPVEGGSVMRYIIFYQNKDGKPFQKNGVVHVL